MNRTYIIGAGSLGRELQLYLELVGSHRRICFLDDEKPNTLLQPVMGRVEEASLLVDDDDALLIAIADPAGRRHVYETLGNCFPSNYAHPTSIGADTHGSAGLMMLPYSLISAGASVGRCLLLNTYASIGHDCAVGDFVTLCSQVVLTGRVKVADNVFIGTGALVAPDVTIGRGAYIGAGSVVLGNVPDGAKMFGNPARRVGSV